jgi:hypothetical protein
MTSEKKDENDDDHQREGVGVGRKPWSCGDYRLETVRQCALAEGAGENADEGDPHLNGR